MSTKRRQIEAAVQETASPILAEMGLEIFEVRFSRQDKTQVLGLFVDHPGGGVTLDELQAASRAVEKSLEIADLIAGRYRLEVSSPGIDRPWKRPEDFARNVGAVVKIKLFSPLPDGRRSLRGTVASAEDDAVTVDPGDAPPLVIPLREISSAKPEIDWGELLKKPAPPERKGSHARRSS